MNENHRISEAEWEVMKVIWSKKYCTANDVIEALEGQKTWNSKTVKTLISRLLNKEIIAYRQEGRTYKYFPILNEDECIRIESISFLKKIYDGSAKALLVNFLEDNYLSDEELDELRRILDERRR